MNILIVGEFSGFAKHLKNGFKKLGHNVTIVMKPDSFKKFKGDNDDILYGYNFSILGHPIRGAVRLLSPFQALLIRLKLWKLYKKNAPDLIFVVNSNFLTMDLFHPGVSLKFIDKQLLRGSKLIMSECGITPADYYNRMEEWKQLGHQILLDDRKYSFLLDRCHIIIPTNYTYYENLKAYANYHRYDVSKVSHAIPLPITVNPKCEITTCKNRKIVIFHGIIRPIEKGTPFIQEAMNRLQAEMSDRVECVLQGGMPYDEYIKLFDRIDILVDQTYGNGWGMNSIIGAMSGKCVLAPCGPENAENMGIPNIPFIQIGPDSEKIYRILKELVLNPERIDEIKRASRQFALDYCECSLIAKKYIETVGL